MILNLLAGMALAQSTPDESKFVGVWSITTFETHSSCETSPNTTHEGQIWTISEGNGALILRNANPNSPFLSMPGRFHGSELEFNLSGTMSGVQLMSSHADLSVQTDGSLSGRLVIIRVQIISGRSTGAEMYMPCFIEYAVKATRAQ